MEFRKTYLPPVFFKMGQQVLHFVAIPIFFFLFLILYKPFSLDTTLELQGGSFAFNAAILSAILFLVLVVTRLILWGLRNVTSFKTRTYYLWCIGEIGLSSLFMSLYVALISRGELLYIDVVPVALAYLAAILYAPYIIIYLLLESDLLSKGETKEVEAARMRFYDEKHNLKFITESSAVLYIESDENYCNIFYSEGARLKKFTLRSTMKSIEEECAANGILRCHRSYYVNTSRIKVLRKERENGTMAEMDISGISGIPVTPRYYESIASRL